MTASIQHAIRTAFFRAAYLASFSRATTKTLSLVPQVRLLSTLAPSTSSPWAFFPLIFPLSHSRQLPPPPPPLPLPRGFHSRGRIIILRLGYCAASAWCSANLKKELQGGS